MDGQGVVADLLGNAPEWQERALCSQTDPEILPGEGWLHSRGQADLYPVRGARRMS
jgi:hypothetical protein